MPPSGFEVRRSIVRSVRRGSLAFIP